MPFQFSPPMKPFIAASIVSSLTTPRTEQRKALTSYVQGSRVGNLGNGYIAITSGTSGSGSGPTVTTGTQLDGTVTWLALGPLSTIEGAANSNIYLAIGKKTEWDVPASPDAPSVIESSLLDVKKDISTLLALNSSSFKLGAVRNDWTSGQVYSSYSPDQSGAYLHPNYVIVNNEHIYKCIDNNNDALSTYAPTGTDSSVVQLQDGYIWKYMGSVSAGDFFKFASTSFIPCPSTNSDPIYGSISTFAILSVLPTPFAAGDALKTLIFGAGTGASAATRTVTAGSDKTLTSIFASSGGQNYLEDTYAIA